MDYAYDAFGNRLSRVQNDSAGNPTSTERYGYDGWDPAKPDATGNENFDAWADLDGSNNLTARRVYGAGFDEPAAKICSGTTWYLADNLGSVRNLANASGTLIGTLAYDGFEQTTTNSGSTDRYQYTGREKEAHNSAHTRCRNRRSQQPPMVVMNGHECQKCNCRGPLGNPWQRVSITVHSNKCPS